MQATTLFAEPSSNCGTRAYFRLPSNILLSYIYVPASYAARLRGSVNLIRSGYLLAEQSPSAKIDFFYKIPVYGPDTHSLDFIGDFGGSASEMTIIVEYEPLSFNPEVSLSVGLPGTCMMARPHSSPSGEGEEAGQKVLYAFLHEYTNTRGKTAWISMALLPEGVTIFGGPLGGSLHRSLLKA
jgi:hypothetical protein